MNIHFLRKLSNSGSILFVSFSVYIHFTTERDSIHSEKKKAYILLLPHGTSSSKKKVHQTKGRHTVYNQHGPSLPAPLLDGRAHHEPGWPSPPGHTSQAPPPSLTLGCLFPLGVC
uniref:Uncharacterized protein n=1 Tax=Arundo donax TaxID=35708 RepID=A0A0A9BHI4_ARUDO